MLHETLLYAILSLIHFMVQRAADEREEIIKWVSS